MSTWFYKLPRMLRLVFVLIMYCVVLVVHISLVYFYNSTLADKVETKPIVRVIQSMPPHTLLQEANLEIKNVKFEDIVEGAYTNIDEVIGKETTTQLELNEQITASKINEVIKKEGQMIVEIPSTWVLSFPQSLRRLDKVVFWPTIDPKDIKKTTEISAINPSQPPSASNVNVALPEEIISNTSMITDVTVAFFKDSQANDVEDSTVDDGSAPRLKANSVGSRLEVAIGKEDFQKMTELAQKGYKFVVGYQ